MFDRINEVKIVNSNYQPFSSFLYKIYPSICRIIFLDKKVCSGFLMKTERENNPFYFLLTSNHIISEENIKPNASIKIYYNNQKNIISIQLNKSERYIRDFKYMGIDAISIEIIPNDNIDQKYFLSPNINYLSEFNKLKLEKINIIKYVNGCDIKYNKNKNINVNENLNEFFYKYKESDSLGCPIFLEDTFKVIGIQTKDNKVECKGNFIWPIINSINKNYTYGKKEEGKIIYEGELKNDKKEGFGKCNFNDKILYIGEWSNNLINGKGKLLNKNKNIIYEGEFVNGKFEGNGKYFYKNGEKYIGQFSENKRNGKGIMYYSNGKIQYEGNFVNDKYEGEGKYYYKNEKYYIGQFSKNKKNGNGIIYYKNGNINYIGDFKDDKFEGNGKYIFENGNYYVGEWSDNKRNGKGKMFNKNEEIIKEGIFVDDKYDIFQN